MYDEIIQELWTTKENLAAQSGFDIRRIAEEIRKSEAQSETEGWRHVPAPELPLSGSVIRWARSHAEQRGSDKP